MGWLKNLFGGSKPIPKIKSVDAQVATEYDMEFIRKGNCPNCETGTLYEGPSAGMSINYRCTTCGQGYNIAFWDGAIIRHWIDNIGINTAFISKDSERIRDIAKTLQKEE